MSDFNDNDAQFMREAIALAARGLGAVSPNPPVGCVIVKNGQVVGRGHHQRFGGPHAEVNAIADALKNAGGDIAGATAYVTLAPCNHYGKTPPCSMALARAGVARVVAAVEDPNPASGGGPEFLRGQGIAVEMGLLRDEAAHVMGGFLKFFRAALPRLRLKYAMTLDGKIAAPDGTSKWISNAESRERVQTLRRQSDAILVGSGTALRDQPRLNVRGPAPRQPLRVVADSRLRLTPDMPLFANPGGGFVVMHALAPTDAKAAALEAIGVKTVSCPGAGGKVDLAGALKTLAADHGVREVLCEGGAALNAALLQNRLADAVTAFVVPKILGGGGLTPAEGGAGFPLSQAPRLAGATVTEFAGDVCIEGDVVYPD